MAEDLTKRLYAIGDKETGILFVTLDPLKVSYIARADVQGYAAANGLTEAEVFSQITSKVKLLFNSLTPPKAEFCFVADLPNMNWEASRIPFPPLFDALDYLAGRKLPGTPPAACPDTGDFHNAWLVKPDDEGQCRVYPV